MSEEQLHEYTKIDPWFLAQLGQLHQTEAWLKTQSLDRLGAEDLLQAKRRGFSDPQIAKAVGARPERAQHSFWGVFQASVQVLSVEMLRVWATC